EPSPLPSSTKMISKAMPSEPRAPVSCLCSGRRLSRSSLIGITTESFMLRLHFGLGIATEKVDQPAYQAGRGEHCKPKNRQTQSLILSDIQRRQEQNGAPFSNAHAVEAQGQHGQQRHHGHEDPVVRRGHVDAHGGADYPDDDNIGTLDKY